jgi:molecular chaperone DnaK (HSP70)
MTRMPRIREMLNNKFRTSNNKSKINCSINPDEAVSVGAAIQGYIISNNDDVFSNSITLMDVTPLSLGVEVIGGVMDTIIERNTMIPVDITKLYSTDTDNIESVLIKIFEGERSITQYNYKIGEFELDNIPITQRGEPEIEITFSIDINGIVTVSAMEKSTGDKKSIIVNTNKNGLTPLQLKGLIEEAEEQETIDEIERIKKFNYYEIEDLCSNVLQNIENKQFKLSKKDNIVISKDIQEILVWLKEKAYSDRDVKEYEEVLQKMKKKYGVLILHGKIEKDKVKGFSNELNATLVNGRDDDEDEEDMKQAFEKIEKQEIGEGLSDNEILEIKEMGKALVELCQNVVEIVSTNKMNITEEHKKEVIDYMNDIMIWRLACEKPTKKDYKEKIDYVNNICNDIVEKYSNDGKELFVNNNDKEEKNSEQLEKLCLTMITMINNKQIQGDKELIEKLKNKIENKLEYLYSEDNNISEDVCLEYIEEINNDSNEIYNNTLGINNEIKILKPVIKSINTPLVVSKNNFNNYQKTQSSEITDTKIKGTSIKDLMINKQNEEIDKIINEQLNI